MEFKFKENYIWKFSGHIWFLISLVYLGLAIFLLPLFEFRFNGMLFLIVSYVPLGFGVGIYYFKLNTIDYIRLSDSELSIYRNLILPRMKISISEIERGKILGEKLILILKNGKEAEVSFKVLTIESIS
ncbi:hypothetical protein [Rummeliibacillus suwonensis]|uniref:hypothetical protein n=1 Tax=Rummeliibacillus suwonensis TaxID=1306154 RepID=UPI0011B48958|nr:hypothetical protein [Rummeliibacillus suwonensis]MBO2535052.1 hypothetical protein [Rummeliibacillus suwonensis]